MKLSQRFTAIAVALSMGAGTIVFPIAAQASEAGKRNTAIGIGAAAAVLLLTQKNKLPGIVAAAGAAVAYKKYDDDVRSRHRRNYGYDNRNDRYNRNNSYNSNRYNQDNTYSSDRYNRDNTGNSDQYYRDDTYASNRDNRDSYNSDDYGDSQDCRNGSGRSAHRSTTRRR